MALRAEIAGALPGEDTVLVDVGCYPGGYAWAFPDGGRATVGVMLDRAHGRQLEEALARFSAGAGLPDRREGIKAAPVAVFRDGGGDCAASGVLLAGDAARLADPFLGEGIYYAMWSGSLAADAILAEGDGETIARRYRESVEDAIRPELRAAGHLGMLFHCVPRWWYWLLSRRPGSALQYAGVLTGEESYRGLARRVIHRLETRAGRWASARMGFGRETERTGTEKAGGMRHD
jgi:flavin-dependent dehydrogenase